MQDDESSVVSAISDPEEDDEEVNLKSKKKKILPDEITKLCKVFIKPHVPNNLNLKVNLDR